MIIKINGKLTRIASNWVWVNYDGRGHNRTAEYYVLRNYPYIGHRNLEILMTSAQGLFVQRCHMHKDGYEFKPIHDDQLWEWGF